MKSLKAEAVPVERIGDRYEVRGVIGRGGMAVVYRVVDPVGSRDLALKQLLSPEDPGLRRDALLLFEREFHTLSQLSHPRVIEVYDYGLDPGGAFYTMELLDGRDLRESSPLPWREACRLLLDVCSSLALLHSRRLLHRDISPRNIRCTRDGLAKLIDFGALCPMGAGGRIVGTPPFVAPEVVDRLALDARTDLFSLGATLYYALTGQSAYPAREFGDLAEVWRVKPPPPSSQEPSVPAALDALVMSLLSLEPALRPRTAFEVMQRLAAIADIERPEGHDAARAYLATPVLLGRDAERATVHGRIGAACGGLGGGVLITGEAGVGRSRTLDACALDAKTLGATVLRASAGAAQGEALAVARVLVRQALETLPADALAGVRAIPLVRAALFSQAEASGARPSLQPAPGSELSQEQLHAALSSFWLELARTRPLVIVVDDVHQIDAASTALLAGLAHRARDLRLLLVLSAASDDREPRSAALRFLRDHCVEVPLSPLSAAATETLLQSVFGDVPHLALVSARIFSVARGNPRECMALARHMIDRGLCSYEDGRFVLPSELDVAQLPSSGEQAFAERVAALPPLARFLAETQALASHEAFSRHEYALLAADSPAAQVDLALNELVAREVLDSDGQLYALSRANSARTLTAGLGADELRVRHRMLASVYEHSEPLPLCAVNHLLLGGLPDQAFKRLTALDQYESQHGTPAGWQLGPLRIATILERVLQVALELGRPPRDLAQFRQFLTALSVGADDEFYHRAAPLWRAQLEHDSGLLLYAELDPALPPGERLRLAFEAAQARYDRTPEAERAYRPDEAIALLVRYVVFSIVIGSRSLDGQLLASLPRLLEPFIALSPLIEAMWQNAIGTFEVNCGALPEQARERTLAVLARLEHVTEAQLRHVDTIRNALAYCVGAIEAGLGIPSAMDWADMLDRDPLQKVNAMHVRKVVLLQRGDFEGAERFRKEAEAMAAAANTRQMFAGTMTRELGLYAEAGDLTGLRQVIDAIEPLAARYPGWVPLRELGEGHLERLHGNLELALSAYERCLALCTPGGKGPQVLTSWHRATSCSMEVMLELGRGERARERGERALRLGRECGLSVVLLDISRALALVEARLGDLVGATARLDAVIAEQLQLGIAGLQLGTSYEARARIAIWAGDREALEEYAALTAREYRHGQGSPLGARYERLLAEAQRAGLVAAPERAHAEATALTGSKVATRSTPAGAAGRAALALRRAQTAQERAYCALGLLREAVASSAGYLYLVAAGDLTLAAGEQAAPSAELTEFVHRVFSEEVEAPETATAIASVPALPTRRQRTRFHDANGDEYEAVLLLCTRERETLCAGIAALRAQRADGTGKPAAELVAIIASQLILTGSTPGVRV